MNKRTGRFIIVEDDPINIVVTEKFIRKESEYPEIRSFTFAPMALRYLEEEYNNICLEITETII